MTIRSLARRGRSLLFAAAPALLAGLAGCTAIEAPETPRAGQPRLAGYACDDGSQLRIEGAGSMVRVSLLGARDAKTGEEITPEPVELPASPPGQSTRFGKDGYALVIEGREALYMKAGRVPLTCTR